ncbi:unnamed protein product, partial [Prorocentrum cordatum]
MRAEGASSSEKAEVSVLRSPLSPHTFIEHIDAAGQRLVTLLSSRYPTDVTEAVSVVVALRQREVPAAASAFDKVLGLVWSRQSSIKDAAVDAFNSMYLEGRDTATAVRSLLQMYQSGCDGGSWTYTHLASVQELIQQAAEKEYIDAKRAIPELVTALKGPSCDMALRALTALGAAAASEAATMLPRVKEAVGPGGACCGANPAERLERARLLCQLLQRLQTCAKVSFKPEVESCLWDLSAHATRLVVESFSRDTVPPQWFGAAQSAMDLSFDLAMSLTHHTDPIQRCPDKLWEQILSRMLFGILPQQDLATTPEDGAEGGEDATDAVVPTPQPGGAMVSGMQIGCAVFVAGHLGLRTLVLLEGLQSALKRKRLQEEDARMAEAREEKKQKKEKDKKKSKGKGKGKEEEDEGGGGEAASMGQAGQEEREAEAFQEIAENGLLFGRRSLLDRVKPLIFQCMLDPTMRSDVTLRRLGALSLCKFMIISKRFCEDNLKLLFSILFPKGKSTSVLAGGDAAEVECGGASALLEDMTLRQSLLVAVGDLLFRHPNTVEPWSTKLYATLAGATEGEPEQAAQMRLTALLVLTHLVLNDMMKPRSVLLVRALWLTACPHEPTARVARILFSELAKRTTNVIYNLLPQIITNLPNHQEAAGQVSGGAEGRVQYIMQFVEKEKHIEGLIEKLTLRLEQAANAAGGSAAAAAAVVAADTQAAETQLDAAADVQEGTAAASVSCLSHAIGAMNYSDRTILRLHDAVVVRKAVNTAISYHSVTRDCFMSIV